MTTANHQTWLAERRKSIGASEAAAILEIDSIPICEYADAYEVWGSKVHGYDKPTTDAMMCGHLAEPDMAYLYQKRTGRPVYDPGETVIARREGYPWLGATLDRRIDGTDENRPPNGCFGQGALELKDVNPEWYPYWIDCEQQYQWDPMTRTRRLCWKAHRNPAEEWALSPPMRFQVQLQIQMFCDDLEWGSLCGKFPGRNIAWRDYPRNDRFLNWAIPKLRQFWDLVERREAPLIRYADSIDVVKAVFTESNGETASIDEETELAALEWEAVKIEHNKLDKRKKLLRAQLMAKIGNADWAELPDGRWLKRMWNKNGYFDLKIVKYKK